VRPPGELRVGLARWTARHPEWGLVTGAAVAWVVVLGARLTVGTPGVAGPAHLGHGGDGLLEGAARPPSATGAVAEAAAWLLMVVAMMGPVLAPRVRRVARSCLGRERRLATGATLVGALAVWSAVGVVAVGLGGTGVTRAVPADPLLVASVWLAVAAWQLGRPKTAALRRCHTLRVPPGGTGGRPWLVAGAAYAGWCVVSCGPAMIGMALTGHPTVLMLVLTVGLTAERVAHRTQPAVRRLAGGLAAAAVLVVLTGSPHVLG
jgi:predicted metal-binding membrane protein